MKPVCTVDLQARLSGKSSGGTARGKADFNLVARPYRFFEYLALGPLLQRTRVQFITQLHDRRTALVLGDGDGRFLAALLAMNRSLSVHAVDTSEVMLSLLLRRAVEQAGGKCGGSSRVHIHCLDALGYSPDFSPDLVVTHFFLDCLGQAEVDDLVRRLATSMAPGGMWLVSEFNIPEGWMQGFARLYVRMLYFAFHVLTGLRVSCLPEYGAVFAEAGLTRIACRRRAFGMLTSELWQKVV